MNKSYGYSFICRLLVFKVTNHLFTFLLTRKDNLSQILLLVFSCTHSMDCRKEVGLNTFSVMCLYELESVSIGSGWEFGSHWGIGRGSGIIPVEAASFKICFSQGPSF